MKMTVNGELKRIDCYSSSISLKEIIETLGYQPQLIVIELNGIIISSNNRNEVQITDGDCLEIVTIVGGGS